MTGPLARSPADLDLAWAQRVVARHEPRAVVERAATVGEDVGTTTRVRLRIEHDGPDGFPRSWFVKLPSRSWRARAITTLPQLPQTEVRFYDEVAPDVPIPVPRPLAAVRRTGLGFTLALADVTETGARPGSPGDALSVEAAGRVVDLLATLHARFWRDGRLTGDLGWLAGPVRRLEDGLGTLLAVTLMKRGLARAGSTVPAALHAGAIGYARRRRRIMAGLASGPPTLVHHDCHPGNLFWHGPDPGLLDWQLVRVGEGIGDIAYLLATSLDPTDRRAHEASLVDRYADRLAAAGVALDRRADLGARYRAHLAYAFEAMVVTLAVGGLMDEPVALELVARTARAVADNETFTDLGA